MWDKPFAAIIILASVCSYCHWASAQQSSSSPNQTVYVGGSVDNGDVIGDQILYLVKQGVSASSRYALSPTAQRTEYEINFLSVSDESNDTSELSDAYTYVLLTHYVGADSFDIFLANGIGTCGQEKIQECANTIVAASLNYFDSINSSR